CRTWSRIKQLTFEGCDVSSLGMRHLKCNPRLRGLFSKIPTEVEEEVHGYGLKSKNSKFYGSELIKGLLSRPNLQQQPSSQNNNYPLLRDLHLRGGLNKNDGTDYVNLEELIG